MSRASRDKFCKGLLARGQPQELREWIRADSENYLGLKSRLGSVRLIEKIYRLGAKKAYGVEIDMNTTGKLVIELPRSHAKRKDLFAWEARAANDQGFSPTPDEGQQWMFVMLD